MLQSMQKFLDCFVETVADRGPALVEGRCSYGGVEPGHPGCAIGCQPGFPEELRGYQGSLQTIEFEPTDSANRILLMGWLGAVTDAEWVFLHGLQKLHDNSQNWHGAGRPLLVIQLRREPLEAFAKKWGLTVPARPNYRGETCSA